MCFAVSQFSDPKGVNVPFQTPPATGKSCLINMIVVNAGAPNLSNFSTQRDLVRVINVVAQKKLVQPPWLYQVWPFVTRDRATPPTAPWPHNYWMEISLISSRLMRYWNNSESKEALNNNNQRFWKMFLALLMKDSKYLRILQMNLLNSCEGLLRSNGWAFMLCVCVAIAFRNMIIGMSTWVKTTVPFGFCWSWLHSCKQSVE